MREGATEEVALGKGVTGGGGHCERRRLSEGTLGEGVIEERALGGGTGGVGRCGKVVRLSPD